MHNAPRTSIVCEKYLFIYILYYINMVKTQLSKMLLSQYGAHSVCAELAKRGKIAELVFQNAPKIDALVYDPETEKTVPIQIKTSVQKSWRTYTGTQKQLEEKFHPNHWYVFVYVNETNRYFIVPGNEVSRLTLEGHLEYLNKPHPRSKKTREEMVKSKGVHGVRLDQVEQFEDKWDFF